MAKFRCTNLWISILNSKLHFKPQLFANGCIGLNRPVTKRSPKLSSNELRQCLDGWPPWNTWCCWHFTHSGTLGITSKTRPGLFVPCLLFLLFTVFHLFITFFYLRLSFLLGIEILNTSSALCVIFKYYQRFFFSFST